MCSAAECVREAINRLDSVNGELNCVVSTSAEHAEARAASIDARIAGGETVGPLTGVPVIIKDNIVMDVGKTTCASRILEGYESPYTATAVERLQNAGAIVIGRANCDEFAMGSSNENSCYGPARNPWDVDRVPGGSSGGSAAAVAARICPAALGSDTGGSVRQPAGFCGVVGLKPTYGRISRYGLVAFGSSLDQIGPITTTVEDAALLLGVMAGADARDSTCGDEPVPAYAAGLNKPVENLRIGVPREYMSDQNDPSVDAAIREAIDVYKSLGAEIVDVDLPLTKYGVATYYVIAPAEASSNLARFDGVRYGRRAKLEAGEGLAELYTRSRSEGFGPEVQRRIMLGTYVLSAGYYDAYYKRAMQVRRLIRQEFDRVFETCHALLGPVAPTPAFRCGDKSDPLSMYLCDVYTVVANMSGHCAVSIPAGFAEVDGAALPIGVQLQCRPFDEATLLRIAHVYQTATQHHLRTPPVAATVQSGDRDQT